MIKVFYRCDESNSPWWTSGKEYEVIDGYVVDDNGMIWSTTLIEFNTPVKRFTRIEREVFTAHGKEWFKHVPVDPIPCGTRKKVYVLLGGNIVADNGEWRWSNDWPWHKFSNIIGWCYADEQNAESQEEVRTVEADSIHIREPGVTLYKSEDGDSEFEKISSSDFRYIAYDPAFFPKENGIIKEGFFNRKGFPDGFHVDTSKIRVGVNALIYIEDMQKDASVFINGYYSERYTNMRRAAMEGSHLTPNQKRHWDESEAKQAAKEQQAKDDKAAAEKDHNERFNGYSDSLAKDYTDKNFSGMMGWRP